MGTGLSEVDVLVRKLDLDSNLDEVRREAAQLIMQQLEASRDPLAPWEKMHFEMAIALLPTVWLRLCLTHIKMASETPVDEVREQIELERADQFGWITRDELIGRLKRLEL